MASPGPEHTLDAMAEEQPPSAEPSSEDGNAMAENQPPRAAKTPGATAGEDSAGRKGAEGADSKRGTLCRSSTDKVIAGVAGGIGAYFGIDAVIVRIAFIVLTFLGGAGPFLYLIGWLGLPREDSPSVVANALRGDSPHRLRSLAAVVLIVLGLLITANLSGELFDVFIDVWSIAPYLALILIAAGVALVLWPGSAGRDRPAPARPLTPPAVATPTPPPPKAAGPEWSAFSGVESSTARGPSHPAAPQPRRQRSMTGLLTIAVLFVYSGGAVILGRLDAIDVDIAAFFAIALAITGAGLAVSAFTRPARGLLAIGVLLLPGAVLFAGADVSWWSGVGERRVAPASAAELQSEYEHGIGRLVLNLEGLPPDGADRSVAVSLGIGEVLVYVPDDIRLTANIDLGVGAVTKRRGLSNSDEAGIYYWDSGGSIAGGSIDSGFGVDTFVISGETGNTSKLNFDIDVGVGAVDIVTVPSTAG